VTAERLLVLDAQLSGIAGDMLVGALLDLGADFSALETALAGVGVSQVSVEEVTRGAIRARHFHVHEHEHEPRSTTHEHEHEHAWKAIRSTIERAPLTDRARSCALRIFTRLADVEGRIHGVAPDDVTFHEVGALDSIADIVGAAVCLDQLDVESVHLLGPVALGGGLVKTAHGMLPVPAPATVALLEGFPVRPGSFADGELTTPTGAAIVAALATAEPVPAFSLGAVGYGAGTRNPADRPNVVRAILGTRAAASAQAIVVLESNLDDLTGEQVPLLIDALLQAGALDAFVAPVLMKKGRPGFFVQALADAGAADAVAECFLRHGSTFGVRRVEARRDVLDRWHERVVTPWGPVRVKIGARKGEVLQVAPELEDVKAVATAAGRSVGEVHRAALAAWSYRTETARGTP
jgi:uncharacterized protein (TIGR00299 family) protein